MKINILAILILCCVGCEPHTHSDDAKTLYLSAFDQIISERYLSHCVSDQDYTNLFEKFRKGGLDTALFLRLRDSLISSVKQRKIPCQIDYRNKFRNDGDSLFVLESLQTELTDAFIDPTFGNLNTNGIAQSLRQPAKILASDLALRYVIAVPHVHTKYRPFGSGMGVISFSKIVFNEVNDKAIMYFEFEAGGKFGLGEVAFLTKVNGSWHIDKFRRVWSS